jgi:oxygen-dependent protoporphyrinogen oxidase
VGLNNVTNAVAVIGGGITGLTAAYRLARRQVPVTLFEAADRAGGVIQSIYAQGYLAEFGPNTILETSPKIGALIRDLGLEPRRWYSDSRADKRFLVRGRRLVPLPASPPAFFATPLFTWRAKLQLLAEPFIPRAPADREESVAEFVLRRLGQEFLDYAINPLVSGVYAGDPARLSVPHAFPKLHEVEQKYGSLIRGQIFGARARKRRGEVSKQNAPKVSFDGGLQVLTDTLQERLGRNVLLNAPVQKLSQTAEGWVVTARVNGSDQQQTFASVLFAGPAYRLPEIQFITARPVDSAAMAEIHYPPVASLVLGFRREDVAHPCQGFGMLIPRIEGFKILGTIFSSSLFPNRAPAGHVTLTSYLGGVRAPELAMRGVGELVDLTVRDLQVLLGVRGRPTFVHHRLYAKAIPQYEVGYGRFKQLMNQMEAQLPGFFLAGHFRDGISLGDSLVSGHNAADRIADYLNQRPKTAPPAPAAA